MKCSPYLDQPRRSLADVLAARTEKTAQGDQFILPGRERSAVQAAASRDAEGRGKLSPRRPQQAPGGMFAEPEPEQPGLFEGGAR